MISEEQEQEEVPRSGPSEEPPSAKHSNDESASSMNLKRRRTESDDLSRSSSTSTSSASSSALSRVSNSSDAVSSRSPTPTPPQSPSLSPLADDNEEHNPWRLEWSLPDSANAAASGPQKDRRRRLNGHRRSHQHNQRRPVATTLSRATFTAGARLTLAPHGSVCFVGRGRLRARSGRASLHGWDLTPPPSADDQRPLIGGGDGASASSFVEFDSPSWNSLVTVEAGGDGAELELRPPIASGVPATPSRKAAFVRVVDAQSPLVRPTVVPDSWRLAADAILHNHRTNYLDNKPNSTARACHPFRVAIAGAKSTGKSTCLRYVVNRFLSEGTAPQVAVLDCDCGQPELGPPGLLTLTMVSEPLLRPPHAHPVRSYQRAYWFGATTPQDDPTRYLDGLRDLVAAAQTQLDASVPLCLNLDGWVKGMGSQVLQSLLDTVMPTHFLQLVGNTKSQHFSVTLDPRHTVHHDILSFNHGKRRFQRTVASTGIETEVSAVTDNDVFTSPATTAAASDEVRLAAPAPISVRASLLRTLRVASYFLQDESVWDRVSFGQSGIVDPDCKIARTLATQRPYRVPFEAVEWGFACPDATRNLRSEDSILDVFNASIVALCHRDVPEESGDDDGGGGGGSGVVLPCHKLPCFGLGIVRSIDRVERVFYILTPVPQASLAKVNCLVHGSISLPPECCFRGVWSESFPYLSMDSGTSGNDGGDGDRADESTTLGGAAIEILGVNPMRSRNNIGRKGLDAAAAAAAAVAASAAATAAASSSREVG